MSEISPWRVATVAEARERGDVPAVIDALASTDRDVRRVAANSLRKLASPLAVDPLLRAARDSTDPDLRILALKALSAIGDRRAAPTVLEIASSDAAFDVRIAAISALVDLEDKRATDLLMGLVANPRLSVMADRLNARSTIRWAVGRLVDLNAVEAIPLLERSLQHLAFRERRHTRRAIRALGDAAHATGDEEAGR